MAREKLQLDAGQIDRVVREVLKQLGEKQIAGTRAKKDESTKNTELALSNRLVTLADLEGKLQGIKQLVVPRGAVITPAVRDRLRDARIAVSYRVTEKPIAAKQRTSLMLGVAEAKCDPTPLIAALGREGTSIEQLARSGLMSVVGELADEVRKGGKLGLLVTGAADVALCVANRQAGVRAVQAVSPEGVRRAVESVGANFLVLDTSGKSLFQQLKIVREFVTPGPRVCPPAWAPILG